MFVCDGLLLLLLLVVVVVVMCVGFRGEVGGCVRIMVGVGVVGVGCVWGGRCVEVMVVELRGIFIFLSLSFHSSWKWKTLYGDVSIRYL